MRTVVSLAIIVAIAAVLAINVAHSYSTRVNSLMVEVNTAIENAKKQIK